MMHRLVLALIGFSLLSACSGKGDFPSLAKRPIESRSNAVIPAGPSAPAPAIEGATRNQINEAVAKAEAGQAGFEAALGEARSAVAQAAGTAFASESWAAAQMAVSALERARAPTKTAMAEIDEQTRVIYERQPDAVQTPLTEATTKIAAIDRRQSEIITALLAQLRDR